MENLGCAGLSASKYLYQQFFMYILYITYPQTLHNITRRESEYPISAKSLPRNLSNLPAYSKFTTCGKAGAFLCST